MVSADVIGQVRDGGPAGAREADALATHPVAGAALRGWCDRHFTGAAAAVLALAAFNLLFRLQRETVGDWDEALYGISAWEAVSDGAWIGTTYLGHTDYYNLKPPLNIWLIALVFEAFGPGLVQLRLVSVVTAWATVAALLLWARRLFGPVTALLSALVLSTTFAFLHIHAARSGNADAPLALVVLLTVITLTSARQNPRRLIWLGPLLAAAFLLKGPAVLLPGAIAALTLAGARRSVGAVRGPLLIALALFALPAGAWALARWSVDGGTFFRLMLQNDLVGITTEVQEGHGGSVLFYLNVLQKYHYDWLGAAALAALLHPRILTRVRAIASGYEGLVIGSWAAVCLVIPSVMQTKLPWYLTPFYPVLALAIGVAIAAAAESAVRTRRWRRVAVPALLVLACGAAEGRFVWYSVVERDIGPSPQALFIAERERLQGARVYRQGWHPGDLFVLRAIAAASYGIVTDADEFVRGGRAGDLLLARGTDPPPAGGRIVAALAGYVLYEHPGPEDIGADGGGSDNRTIDDHACVSRAADCGRPRSS